MCGLQALSVNIKAWETTGTGKTALTETLTKTGGVETRMKTDHIKNWVCSSGHAFADQVAWFFETIEAILSKSKSEESRKIHKIKYHHAPGTMETWSRKVFVAAGFTFGRLLRLSPTLFLPLQHPRKMGRAAKIIRNER